MKTRLKFLLFIPILLLSSCTKDMDPINEIHSKPFEYSKKSIDESFLKSVAIIQGGVELDRSTAKYSLIMEVKDFSGEYRLHDAFMIDGIEYSDNGKFNDDVANDGIYTSVNQYNLDAPVVNKLINNYYIHHDTNFAYESELEDYMRARPTFGISMGCNVRLVDCPETSWYNDCWFGSPCTCIEFYDCYVEVGVGI